MDTRIVVAAVALAVAAHAQEPAAPEERGVYRVFLLAGQSNMEGQAVVGLDHAEHYNGGRGNLEHVLADPAVGPRYRYEKHPAPLLESCYRNSLKLALKHELKSIAFPAISCGVYAYPPEEAGEIAIRSCLEPEWNGLEITLCLFEKRLVESWSRILQELNS